MGLFSPGGPVVQEDLGIVAVFFRSPSEDFRARRRNSNVIRETPWMPIMGHLWPEKNEQQTKERKKKMKLVQTLALSAIALSTLIFATPSQAAGRNSCHYGHRGHRGGYGWHHGGYYGWRRDYYGWNGGYFVPNPVIVIDPD